jgi:hypothetical protein
VALGALVLAGPMVESTVAMRRKPRFSALVDGKRFKALRRAVSFIYTTTTFSAAGQTRVKRGVSRFISVNCGAIDLRATAVPTPALSCYGTYQENVVRGAGGQKTWISEGMELTVDSFDGTRVTGTFRGVIQPSASNPSEPPVTIEQGTFSAVIRDLGV